MSCKLHVNGKPVNSEAEFTQEVVNQALVVLGTPNHKALDSIKNAPREINEAVSDAFKDAETEYKENLQEWLSEPLKEAIRSLNKARQSMESSEQSAPKLLDTISEQMGTIVEEIHKTLSEDAQGKITPEEAIAGVMDYLHTLHKIKTATSLSEGLSKLQAELAEASLTLTVKEALLEELEAKSKAESLKFAEDGKITMEEHDARVSKLDSLVSQAKAKLDLATTSLKENVDASLEQALTDAVDNARAEWVSAKVVRTEGLKDMEGVEIVQPSFTKEIEQLHIDLAAAKLQQEELNEAITKAEAQVLQDGDPEGKFRDELVEAEAGVKSILGLMHGITLGEGSNLKSGLLDTIIAAHKFLNNNEPIPVDGLPRSVQDADVVSTETFDNEVTPETMYEPQEDNNKPKGSSIGLIQSPGHVVMRRKKDDTAEITHISIQGLLANFKGVKVYSNGDIKGLKSSPSDKGATTYTISISGVEYSFRVLRNKRIALTPQAEALLAENGFNLPNDELRATNVWQPLYRTKGGGIGTLVEGDFDYPFTDGTLETPSYEKARDLPAGQQLEAKADNQHQYNADLLEAYDTELEAMVADRVNLTESEEVKVLRLKTKYAKQVLITMRHEGALLGMMPAMLSEPKSDIAKKFLQYRMEVFESMVSAPYLRYHTAKTASIAVDGVLQGLPNLQVKDGEFQQVELTADNMENVYAVGTMVGGVLSTNKKGLKQEDVDITYIQYSPLKPTLPVPVAILRVGVRLVAVPMRLGEQVLGQEQQLSEMIEDELEAENFDAEALENLVLKYNQFLLKLGVPIRELGLEIFFDAKTGLTSEIESKIEKAKEHLRTNMGVANLNNMIRDNSPTSDIVGKASIFVNPNMPFVDPKMRVSVVRTEEGNLEVAQKLAQAKLELFLKERPHLKKELQERTSAINNDKSKGEFNKWGEMYDSPLYDQLYLMFGRGSHASDAWLLSQTPAFKAFTAMQTDRFAMGQRAMDVMRFINRPPGLDHKTLTSNLLTHFKSVGAARTKFKKAFFHKGVFALHPESLTALYSKEEIDIILSSPELASDLQGMVLAVLDWNLDESVESTYVIPRKLSRVNQDLTRAERVENLGFGYTSDVKYQQRQLHAVIVKLIGQTTENNSDFSFDKSEFLNKILKPDEATARLLAEHGFSKVLNKAGENVAVKQLLAKSNIEVTLHTNLSTQVEITSLGEQIFNNAVKLPNEFQTQALTALVDQIAPGNLDNFSDSVLANVLDGFNRMTGIDIKTEGVDIDTIHTDLSLLLDALTGPRLMVNGRRTGGLQKKYADNAIAQIQAILNTHNPSRAKEYERQAFRTVTITPTEGIKRGTVEFKIAIDGVRSTAELHELGLEVDNGSEAGVAEVGTKAKAWTESDRLKHDAKFEEATRTEAKAEKFFKRLSNKPLFAAKVLELTSKLKGSSADGFRGTARGVANSTKRITTTHTSARFFKHMLLDLYGSKKLGEVIKKAYLEMQREEFEKTQAAIRSKEVYDITREYMEANNISPRTERLRVLDNPEALRAFLTNWLKDPSRRATLAKEAKAAGVVWEKKLKRDLRSLLFDLDTTTSMIKADPEDTSYVARAQNAKINIDKTKLALKNIAESPLFKLSEYLKSDLSKAIDLMEENYAAGRDSSAYDVLTDAMSAEVYKSIEEEAMQAQIGNPDGGTHPRFHTKTNPQDKVTNLVDSVRAKEALVNRHAGYENDAEGFKEFFIPLSNDPEFRQHLYDYILTEYKRRLAELEEPVIDGKNNNKRRLRKLQTDFYLAVLEDPSPESKAKLEEKLETDKQFMKEAHERLEDILAHFKGTVLGKLGAQFDTLGVEGVELGTPLLNFLINAQQEYTGGYTTLGTQEPQAFQKVWDAYEGYLYQQIHVAKAEAQIEEHKLASVRLTPKPVSARVTPSEYQRLRDTIPEILDEVLTTMKQDFPNAYDRIGKYLEYKPQLGVFSNRSTPMSLAEVSEFTSGIAGLDFNSYMKMNPHSNIKVGAELFENLTPTLNNADALPNIDVEELSKGIGYTYIGNVPGFDYKTIVNGVVTHFQAVEVTGDIAIVKKVNYTKTSFGTYINPTLVGSIISNKMRAEIKSKHKHKYGSEVFQHTTEGRNNLKCK